MSLLLLAVIVILIVATKAEFLQLVNPYSITARSNKSSFSSAYSVEGDVVETSNSFQLTTNGTNTQSYGRIITKGDLNLSSFEYQIQLRMDNAPSIGSMVGIWFYNSLNESKDLNSTQSFFGFNEDFSGFGIVADKKPNDKADMADTEIKLIISKDAAQVNTLAQPLNSCKEGFKSDEFKIIIRYLQDRVSVQHSNKHNLIKQCISYEVDKFDSTRFKIAITSFKGLENSIQYKDTVEVLKISLINKDKTLSAFLNQHTPPPQPALTESSFAHKKLTQPIEDLVNEYSLRNKGENRSSLNDLQGQVSNLIAHFSKIQTEQGSKANLSEVFQSLKQMSSSLQSLTALLNNTNTLMPILGNRNMTQRDREKLLSIELDVLLEKWNQFRLNLRHKRDTLDFIRSNIRELQSDIQQAQSMQASIGNSVMKQVASVTKDIDKKIQSNVFYYYILIGLFAFGIVIMIWIYQKLKQKQKKS